MKIFRYTIGIIIGFIIGAFIYPELKAQKVHKQATIGSLFYVRWGNENALRRYRVVDTSGTGYFVKWCDAGTLDSKSTEFMPLEIQNQQEFKIIKK